MDSLISFINHDTYFEIAYKHFLLADTLSKERDRIINSNISSSEEEDHMFQLVSSTEHHSMVSVVFSALTLEAFINHYCIMKKSKTFLKKYLDKLDTPSKWVIIPQLINEAALDNSDQIYGRLKSLFSQRNLLVHYKSKKKEIFNDAEYISEKNAREAIATVLLATDSIKKL